MSEYFVLHRMEKIEDDSIFGPFESSEQAYAFIEQESAECRGQDIVKIIQPVKVNYSFEIEDGGWEI